MSPPFALLRFPSAFRRVLVGLCIIALLGVTTGFPLPQAKDLPAASTRFPCEKHRCGCATAEHCWRSCCCMSKAEKLAWAERNDVAPPDYLLAASDDAEQAEVHACCSRSREADDPPARREVAERGCCAPPAESDPHEEPAAAEATPQFAWVYGIQAQHCQGLATIWVVAGAVLPPPPPVAAPVDLSPPIWLSPPRICRWQSVSRNPDVPPPRCA